MATYPCRSFSFSCHIFPWVHYWGVVLVYFWLVTLLKSDSLSRYTFTREQSSSSLPLFVHSFLLLLLVDQCKSSVYCSIFLHPHACRYQANKMETCSLWLHAQNKMYFNGPSVGLGGFQMFYLGIRFVLSLVFMNVLHKHTETAGKQNETGGK